MRRARIRLKKKFGDSLEVSRVGSILLFPSLNRMVTLGENGEDKPKMIEMDSALFPGVKRLRRTITEIEVVENGYEPEVRVSKRKKTRAERAAMRKAPPEPDYSLKDLAAQIRLEFPKRKIREIETSQGTRMIRDVSWIGFPLPLVRREVTVLADTVQRILDRFENLAPGKVPSMFYFDQHELVLMVGPIPE